MSFSPIRSNVDPRNFTALDETVNPFALWGWLIIFGLSDDSPDFARRPRDVINISTKTYLETISPPESDRFSIRRHRRPVNRCGVPRSNWKIDSRARGGNEGYRNTSVVLLYRARYMSSVPPRTRPHRCARRLSTASGTTAKTMSRRADRRQIREPHHDEEETHERARRARATFAFACHDLAPLNRLPDRLPSIPTRRKIPYSHAAHIATIHRREYDVDSACLGCQRIMVRWWTAKAAFLCSIT